MRKNKIKDALINSAPNLAHALGGPFAAIAVDLLSKKFLGKKGDENDLLQYLECQYFDPVKLKELDLKYQEILLSTELELERINAKDRDSARIREASIADNTPKLLAFAIITGYFFILVFVFFIDVPNDKQGEFAILLGALSTMTAAVVNYYFGSSLGSKDKTTLLGRSNLPRK